MTVNILRTGDLAIYEPNFGPALVVVRPGVFTGSGEANAEKSQACVLGDESSAQVPGCAYTSGGFTIPGVGTLSIVSLGPDQVSKTVKSGGKPVVVKGTKFIAQFQVTVPAQMPAVAPIPDPVPIYMGQGSLQITNQTVNARK